MQMHPPHAQPQRRPTRWLRARVVPPFVYPHDLALAWPWPRLLRSQPEQRCLLDDENAVIGPHRGIRRAWRAGSAQHGKAPSTRPGTGPHQARPDQPPPSRSPSPAAIPPQAPPAPVASRPPPRELGLALVSRCLPRGTALLACSIAAPVVSPQSSRRRRPQLGRRSPTQREWPQIPHPAASPTQREWPQIWRGGAAGEAADLHHRQGGGSRCRAWAAPQHFEELLVVARPERRRDDRLGNRN